MQRLLFILLSLFFFIVSCGKQKPSGVLSEHKMGELLTEVSLIDAYLNTLPIDSGRKVMPVLYGNIFKEFDIDSTQFKYNLDFYYGNPKLTEKIYTVVEGKLREYEKEYRVKDSIVNAFLQDSIRRVSRLQQLSQVRYDMAMNYYKDTSAYTYRNDGLNFLTNSELYLNAYGIQIPAVPSSSISIAPIEPLLQDTLLQKYLNPIHKLLLDNPKDTASFDYKLFGVYFLENADLHVRSGYSSDLSLNNNTLLKVDDTIQAPKENSIEEALPEELPAPEGQVRDNPVQDNKLQTIPKKLQIQQSN